MSARNYLSISLFIAWGFAASALAANLVETSYTSSQGWTSDITQPACGGPSNFLTVGAYQTGFSGGGGWATAAGSCEQITTAANYPGGTGGRGQRHWIGDGHNNNSGSMKVQLPARVQELWGRYYSRWEPGLVWGFPGNSGNQKIVYLNGGYCGSNVTGCYFLLESSNLRLSVAGNNWSNTGWGWTNMNGNVNASDGAWRCFEFHLKNESNNSLNDGVAQMWVDGTLQLDRADVDFQGSDGFAGFFLPENANVTTLGRDMFNDFDDIAISTISRIGCLSSIAQPCDVNADGSTNVSDVQVCVNQAIGVSPCTADINQDGACNVIDVQRVVNAALGGPCVSP